MSVKIAIPLVGGLLAGISASLCCLAPFVLLLLGFSGVWLGHFTALAPLRPIFITVAVATLILAYWQLYKPESCRNGCIKPPTRRVYKVFFWCVVAMVFVAILSPHLIALFFG